MATSISGYLSIFPLTISILPHPALVAAFSAALVASSSRLRVREGLQCTTSAMHRHTHTHLASQTSSRGTGFQLMRTKHSVNSRHVLRILTQLVRRWRQLCLEDCIPSGPHGTCLMLTMRVAGYLCQWFHCINCMSKADGHDADHSILHTRHTGTSMRAHEGWQPSRSVSYTGGKLCLGIK